MSSLQELKAVELEILNATINVLNKNNLRWYLLYGSCIGAVRHHGFIPWDDDIDIGLMRSDYEKAKQVLKKQLPSDFIFCDRSTEPDYPYNFAKVRKDNTAFVHSGDAHLHMHQGIYIDIFPLDKCPKDDNSLRKLLRRIKRCKQMIDLAYMNTYKGKQLRPLWQRTIIVAGHLVLDRHKLQDCLDDLCQSIKENEGWICSFLGDYGERAKAKSDWFGEGVWVPFETIKCRIPSHYDNYLTGLYGDYMKLPPEENREPKHDAVFVSVTENYTSDE